jgi:hypothetical protein
MAGDEETGVRHPGDPTPRLVLLYPLAEDTLTSPSLNDLLPFSLIDSDIPPDLFLGFLLLPSNLLLPALVIDASGFLKPAARDLALRFRE